MQLRHQPLVLLLLTAILGAAMPPALAQGQDHHKGLWHAYGAEEKGTLFFLVYNGDQSKVYGPDWRRVDTDLTVEGDSLEFQLPQGNYRHRIEVRFEDGSLTGTYLRPHPQYPWKGRIHSFRVSADPEWDPWAFLSEARGSVINPWPAILKEAPRGDAEAFRAYWKAQIEPRYYALFTHTLYANETSFFLPELRVQALDELYRLVSRQSDDFQPLLENFKDSVSQVFADLREQYSWMRIPGIVFPLLEDKDYDFGIRVVNVEATNNRPFLLFNARWMARHLKPAQERYLLAQGLLEFEHESRLAIPNFLRNAIARRGIAAYLASKLDYSDSPVDYLFQPEEATEEELEAAFKMFRSTLGRSFSARVHSAGFDPFQGEYRAPGYVFAYGFASKMAERFSDRQLAQEFDYERLSEEMVAYGRSIKSRPDPAKPEKKSAPQETQQEKGQEKKDSQASGR